MKRVRRHKAFGLAVDAFRKERAFCEVQREREERERERRDERKKNEAAYEFSSARGRVRVADSSYEGDKEAHDEYNSRQSACDHCEHG